jgi:hypothetical protein
VCAYSYVLVTVVVVVLAFDVLYILSGRVVRIEVIWMVIVVRDLWFLCQNLSVTVVTCIGSLQL